MREANRGSLIVHDLDTLEREYALREAARKRFMAFCAYMFPPYRPTPFHQLLAGALELVEARTISRLMVFTPPQHGKSTQVSHLFPPWYLGRNPDHDIILCSYNAALAEQHSFRARSYMLEDRYRAVFGDRSPHDIPIELSERSQSTKHWRLKNHRGSLKAAGVGGGVTGYSARAMILDDPLGKAEDADSEKIRQAQIEWYDSEAYTRLSPDGVIILCMTRWHEDDLAGKLLKRQAEGGEKWHVLRLPALAETPEQRREWCERHYVDRDHYIVADRVPTSVRNRAIKRTLVGAARAAIGVVQEAAS